MRRTNTLLILAMAFGLGLLVSTAVHLGGHSNANSQFALQEAGQAVPFNR